MNPTRDPLVLISLATYIRSKVYIHDFLSSPLFLPLDLDVYLETELGMVFLSPLPSSSCLPSSWISGGRDTNVHWEKEPFPVLCPWEEKSGVDREIEGSRRLRRRGNSMISFLAVSLSPLLLLLYLQFSLIRKLLLLITTSKWAEPKARNLPSAKGESMTLIYRQVHWFFL